MKTRLPQRIDPKYTEDENNAAISVTSIYRRAAKRGTCLSWYDVRPLHYGQGFGKGLGISTSSAMDLPRTNADS